MKAISVVLLFVGCACARPQIPTLQKAVNDILVYITRYENNIEPSGNYNFAYEESDGQVREEVGEFANPGTDDESLIVRGYYAYPGEDGNEIRVAYTADDQGFHPQGEHLPPSAGVLREKPPLGIPPGGVAALAGGGLG